MSHKPTSSTRIPTISKANLLRGAAASYDLSSNTGNSNLKNTKPTFSRTHLRRSKSLTDLNSVNSARPLPNTKPNLNSKPVAPAIKRPLKRLALTETTVPNKISKTVKPERAEPIKPTRSVQPKIAPYDYKARFNHLKEVHEKLKETHRILKEEHVTTADQNEDLVSRISQLQKDHNVLQKLHDDVSCKYENLKERHKNSAERISVLEVKNDKLEEQLKSTTESLEFATKDNTELKSKCDELSTILKATDSELQINLKQNALMKDALFTLQKEKRSMHNTIQELKGNIRVFCRIRPPLISEQDKELYRVNYVDEKSVELFNKDKKVDFSFDKVFGPNTTQGDIFEELSQLVQSAVDGYNVCVFAYGQTGSGKTYTMEGGTDSESRGMIPRSIDTIFTTLDSIRQLGWVYTVQATFLEIYNENIVDLLDPGKTNLDIRMCDAKGTDVYVSNLKIEEIKNADQLKKLMRIAQTNRAVAATENNERSSRSHSVTKITLEGQNAEQGQKCTGNLNLIDLAGSEKFHTNETVRFRETSNINRSLSNLSNVILCLVKKTSHIPYRNSKLTHLLMPSLGGNSKTLMLVNISPLNECYNESVNSLRFASQVNQCKTGAVKKQKSSTNL